MKKKIVKVALVAVVGLVAGINVFNAQKSEILSEMTLTELEAGAHTVGCETSYGSPLYYCIDWSVISICTCANTHAGHVLSYCPDRLCRE